MCKMVLFLIMSIYERTAYIKGIGFLWPNTAINVYGNGASIERIVPVSENQTEIVYQHFFDTSDKEITETIAESEQLTKEDA